MIQESKVNEITKRYLVSRHYEILEQDFNGVPFIVKTMDDGNETLVFIMSVIAGDREFPTKEPVATSECERVMLDFVNLHPELSDGLIRFDAIFVATLKGGNRALVRHELNAYARRIDEEKVQTAEE